ncbi:putative integral membrane protein [Streptomyces ambofaciens ATCC 23877]|uniref:Putative integral membrane protein n=1 Tax=Streptomyces ambofaciens (strain ATCC 23877 / 3486 / DSM 40053 / JCM 4204 / NBRC 12836 / NRRL B-2516) TaxID=278992 RepID=A3KJX2_STRA7|nr:glycosyltransferase [Streptomyces ambofaciens]AKZ54163.1 putative integral membrane protein [Streptomyces ambofaciens ATCC 23877]CAJ90007.1 putative integral membrane protein [Streptomyces ambofaciens ATCC 23877]
MSADVWTSAVTVVPALSLAVWLWLLFARGFFWRTDVRLPELREPADWPAVCVVVPARDEAAVLGAGLPSLLGQDYPGRAEVFLIDDGSTDGTGGLACELARGHGGLPLTVASPGEPPAGWTGKLWAVRHGIGLARGREPEYLLLTDADIAHAPDSLRRLVAAARTGGFDVVSQMARLRVDSGWERLVVPAFVYFFAQLYPFRWISRERAQRGGRAGGEKSGGRRGTGTAAAAGGCVLLRAEAAERARIPDAIRHAVIDDVALARAVKGCGGRVWLGLADRVDSVRPYPRLHDLWRMVSRSAYAQLRHSPPLLAGTVAGLALVYLVPPVSVVVGAVTGAAAGVLLGAAAWLVMAGTYVPMLRYYRQPGWLAPLLPFTALLYLLMTVDSAVQHYRGRGAAWKGRTYARPEAVPDEG